jgi:lysophospholipase L1-like esterase
MKRIAKQLRSLAGSGIALALVVAACSSIGSDGGGGGRGEGGSSSATGGGAEGGSSGGGGTTGTAGTKGEGGAGGSSSGGRGGATGGADATGGGGAGAAGRAGSTGVGGSTGVAGRTGNAGSGGNGAAGQGAAMTGGRGGAGAGGRGGTSGSGGSAAGTGGSPAPDAGTVDGGTNYNPCPTTSGTACAILPLGDSITEGCCTAPEGGYRIELFTKAVNSKQTITFVGGTLGIGDAKPNGPATVAGQTFPQGNEGNGGYTIDSPSTKGGIAGAITDQSCSTYKPNIILLMIGTNDILQNIDLPNAPTRLGKLMDEIITDAPAALLVVSSIPPCCNDTTVQAYNATIPELVKTRAQAGKHVLFVDAHAAFVKDANYKADYISSDGLHPSTNGYAVIGDLFYAAISRYLP